MRCQEVMCRHRIYNAERMVRWFKEVHPQEERDKVAACEKQHCKDHNQSLQDNACTDPSWAEVERSLQPPRNMRTGEVWTMQDAVSGLPRPRRRWERSYSCGGALGCQTLLFGRSGAFGLMDLAIDGFTTIAGIRGGWSDRSPKRCDATPGRISLPVAAS